MKYLLIFTICFLGFSSASFAQDNPAASDNVDYIDVIYLKDGSEFRGTILEYKVDESVEVRLLGGQVITFRAKNIKKIVQECLDCTAPKVVKAKKEYNFREKGIYNFTSVASFNSINDRGEVTLGLSINHVVGYQFNRYIGLGVGTGYDNFVLGNPLSAIPLFVEARGYLLEEISSPYYSINTGVGFPVKRDEANIIGGSPGFLFHPAVGYRVGSKRVNFVLDIGYKIQKITYEYQPTWELKRLEHHSFKRLTVRFGVLF